jgi:uncharacterized membrane protein
MIQNWPIGIPGVVLVAAALVFIALGLKRRPPSVPLTGSGILTSVFGLALLYAAAFPPGPPAWEGYLLLGGGATIDLAVIVWAVADAIVGPNKGILRPDLVERRCKLRLAAGLAVIGGEATALLVIHPAFAAAVLILAASWVLWWLPPSRRLTTSEATVVVARPVEKVFDYMTTIENNASYIPEIKQVVRLTQGPIGKGTVYRARSAHFEWEQEVIEVNPPTSISEHVVAGERNRATTRFESIDEGTRVSFSYEWEMSLARAVIGQGLYVARLRLELPERRQRWYKNLKDVLEADQTA